MEARGEGDLKRAHLWTDVLEDILGDLKLKSQYTSKNPGVIDPESSQERRLVWTSMHRTLYCFLMVCCLGCGSVIGRAAPLALLEAWTSCGGLGVSLEGRHPCSLFVRWSTVTDSAT